MLPATIGLIFFLAKISLVWIPENITLLYFIFQTCAKSWCNGIIHHCLWYIIQDFWICLFYWTRPVYKQGYKFFSRWAKRNREKLIALFVNWSSLLIKNKQIPNSVMWFLKQWCIIFYTMFCQILHK